MYKKGIISLIVMCAMIMAFYSSSLVTISATDTPTIALLDVCSEYQESALFVTIAVPSFFSLTCIKPHTYLDPPVVEDITMPFTYLSVPHNPPIA